MVDNISPSERSERMRRVKRKHTAPELTLRKLIHVLGYRYRLHSSNLPGSPDLVFPARRKVIFIHGCFWHGHGFPCIKSKLPASNVAFWMKKRENNMERDQKNISDLKYLGWQALVIWQCELKKANRDLLVNKIKTYLAS